MNWAMAEIVNLRQFRKNKQRDEAAKTADQNRTIHGRSKTEKQQHRAEKAAAKTFLDGHRREPK